MAKHKLDKLFSEKLAEFEASPSSMAWEQIESQLDQKKGRSLWLWAGIAASAALLVASSWLMLSDSTEVETYNYEYAEAEINSLSLPAEVVYVPIYIYTVIESPAVAKDQPAMITETSNEEAVLQEDQVVLAQNKEIPVERTEIITLKDVPLVTAEEVLLASADTPVAEEPAALQPVTIIYKQGEPAKESNFVRAMNYMEEVRMGEKKLVNFDKLKENLRSRFRSEEGTD